MGKPLIPYDLWVYDRPISGLGKDEHLRAMFKEKPRRKALSRRRLKQSRMVSLGGKEKVPTMSVGIPKGGRFVRLWGFGFVRVFRTVSKGEDAKYWATSDLKMIGEDRTKCLEAMFEAERAQARKAVAMLKHLLAQSTFEIIPNRVSPNINYHE